MEDSGDDDLGSIDGVVLDGGKRLVGLLQREHGYFGLQPDVGGDLEKIAGAGSGWQNTASD